MNPSKQRSTKQRAAIEQAMAKAGRPLAPQEVLELAQATLPGLGIATVYRALKAMAEEGFLHEVHLPERTPCMRWQGTATIIISNARSASGCSMCMPAPAIWRAWRQRDFWSIAMKSRCMAAA
jgi:Fe2+ or Zn2+ uptake regulation protein